MKKIKIQFIGTFIKYKAINLDAIELEYFKAVANRIGIKLEEALIDPFFYHKLKLYKYQSFEDLNGISYFGLDVNSFHQIEVFVDGYKKQKFSYFDLNTENVLFPLYSSEITYLNILQNQLVIRTKEKGNINYAFQNYNEKAIDEIISFNLSKIEIELLLSGLHVEESKLSINRTDTLIIEQFVIAP
jgi:hypothetical protein